MITPVSGSLCYERLYDGAGLHLGGLYPPICVQNELTADYHASKAIRPASRAVGVDLLGQNLGLVWMAPVGLLSAGPMSTDVLGLLVQTRDAGQGVMIHADDDRTAQAVAELVWWFTGGGHA